MNKNKILVLGAGFIGKRIQRDLNCRICAKRIRGFKNIEAIIMQYKPEIIINCIGYVGRNVDECESDKDKTLFANTYIPILLAEAAFRHGIKLIHISSGCIFRYDYKQGRPINEKQIPDFLELFYSRSKIYSEAALKTLLPESKILILRIRMPLDNRPHPRNILNKLIKYKTVITVANSITYLPDFIMALKYLININADGVYNVVNDGSLCYPDLMDVYRKYRPDYHYKRIDFKKLGLVRTNLLLSTKKLKQSGFKVRDIKKVLEECVKEYVKY